MVVEVQPLQEATESVVAQLAGLVRQLSESAPPLTGDQLRAVLQCPSNTLLTARLDGKIVGMLTLVVFPLPTGGRAWIEDVVVDEAARGHGIATALTREAVRIAHEGGVRSVDLTSRPSRVAANRLYESLGFELRDSRVYRARPVGQPSP
jgi:ribosomal protein S18 acetylase RimI-like enzyme